MKKGVGKKSKLKDENVVEENSSKRKQPVSEMTSLSSGNTNVVFIDTILDTRLLTVFSDHDTIFVLKKRIKSEHLSHYPQFGLIHIHEIKALLSSDSLCVRKAFNGSDKSWLLRVEAALGEGAQNDQLIPHASSNQVACHYIANNAIKDVRHVREDDLSISGPSAKTKRKCKRKRKRGHANIENLNVSSKFMDVNGMIVPVKSKKKRTRKARNSGQSVVRNSAIEENPLNQSEGGKNQLEDMQQIALSVARKEDDFSMDSISSLEQIKTKSNAEHLLISNSKLESTNKIVKNKEGKSCGKNDGGVVSNIQQRKSLFTGGFVKFDSSWTSSDEPDNSDVSARTSPDRLLMSDSSDGDSSADLNSQQHGAYGGDRMENGGGSSLKASLPSTKGMSLEMLLRSSSMYKNALKRTSELDESESQPMFVPDSLPDT